MDRLGAGGNDVRPGDERDAERHVHVLGTGAVAEFHRGYEEAAGLPEGESCARLSL